MLIANYISSLRHKIKSRTKLTKLFIHKLGAWECICHYLQFAGFKGIIKLVLWSKKKAEVVSDCQAFYKGRFLEVGEVF